MRRLSGVSNLSNEATRDSTMLSLAAPLAATSTNEPSAPFDARVIVRELETVAEYIQHIKAEIGVLRANELCRERLPKANEELGNVVQVTATATNTIMSAAEEILETDEVAPELYRTRVESKLVEIFEACSFQDLTGQRITKVLEALRQVETRLGRFARAVNVGDADPAPDPEETLMQARRDVLLLNGPQADGIAQADIDKMFA